MSDHMMKMLLTSIFSSFPFMQPWAWISVVVILFIGIIAALVWQIHILKSQRADLQGRAQAHAELLNYAVESEKKAKATASEAIRTKSLLLVRINHEIRTPLNGIQGMTSLMAETPLSSEQEEYNDTIRECGDNLLKVVNDILLKDILDFSKVEPGKVQLERKDFNLENTVEEVLDVFGNKAAKANVDIVYNLCPNVPTHITGDKIRISQVLTNLIENSLRYTREGEILIRVKLQDTGEGNAVELGFEVQDTGTGISPDQLNVLLADMSSLNSTLSTDRDGVGLIICKKLVELMGGTIHIESRPGSGTSVFFSLRTASSIPSHQPNYGLDKLEGKRILVIEDSASHGHFIKEQLQEWKLKAEVVPTGQEALVILSRIQDIALILIDHQVLDMCGVDVATAIRKLYPSLPLILLSPKDDGNVKVYPDLFRAVVFKPLKKHVLSKSILSCFRHPNKTRQEETSRFQKLSSTFAAQHPLRILIAEDNLTNQKLALRVLGKLGYTPDVANHGKEALEMVRGNNYDVILMDVQMPEMDGLEASRMIRMLLNSQPIIIAMTANTLQGDREICLQAGMDDYISKPISLEDLVDILEKWAIHIREKQ